MTSSKHCCFLLPFFPFSLSLSLFRDSCPPSSLRGRGTAWGQGGAGSNWDLPAADLPCSPALVTLGPPGHTEEGHDLCSSTRLLPSFLPLHEHQNLC